MIVLDASVAAAVFLPERHASFAHQVFAGANDLHAPDILAAEVGSALVRAYRRKLIAWEEAKLGVERLLAGMVTLHVTPPLLPAAAELACAQRCSIYDAAYIELARRMAATVVTNDGRLAVIARLVGVRAHRPEDGPLPG